MPYVDLAGLSRFAGKSKDFASSACAVPDMANWRRTAAAGAVSFLPVPEMPLDPVVNFLFTETGPAEGTKGPDNPSIITGVSSVKVTRCGKNLVPQPSNGTAVRNGVTFVVADGVFTATGTAGSGNAALYIATATGKDLRVVQGHTYCLSGCPVGGTSSTYYINANIYDDNGNAIAYNVLRDYGSGATYTAPSNGWLTVYIGVVSGVDVSGLVFKPQIEDSTSATVFEPSESTVYTIDLGNTFYGGSVDLSAGTMTVTWWSDTLSNPTTVEVLSNNTVRATYATSKSHMGSGSAPTYFHSNYDDDGSIVYPRFSAGTARASISMSFTRLGFDYTPTIEEATTAMASFLEAHPCVVVYKLYNPITVQLTPTQIYSLSQADPYTPRTNTVYSNQISVQVGYPKSPQATQNELTNAVVSLGGNV